MTNNKIVFAVLGAAVILTGCQTVKVAPDAAQLDVAFEWPTKSGCTAVSPAMTIGNIPAETKFLEIKLTDLDKPSYDHGGGVLAYDGTGKIAAGALPPRGYAGPCPPMGWHRYEITVFALNADKSVALGTGSAMRKFPE